VADAKHIERLVFIKYMVGVADAQSQLPEPLNSLALLTYHDAIELFLGLALDALGAKVDERRPDFGDYFAAIDASIGGAKKISHVEAMKNMNRARTSLKHAGLLPSRNTVERTRSNVLRFLSDNVPTIFLGHLFESVSLLDLVQSEGAKRHLVEAVRLNGTNATDDRRLALIAVTVAFGQLLQEYEDRKKKPLWVGSYTSVIAPDIDFPSYYINNVEDDDTRMALTRVAEATDTLADAIVLLRLGIDGRKFARFDALTPSGVDEKDGVYVFAEPPHMEEPDGFDFCLTFVVEVALQLQALDFDLSRSPADADAWTNLKLQLAARADPKRSA
jgi:hypothetical protein